MSHNLPDIERRDQVAREDLVMFINACFACTGQREFYSSGDGQRVSIDFLHQYVLANYRKLYARTLAAGINHFNQAQVILGLLQTGRAVDPEFRDEEGHLISACLRNLPPQRAWKVLEQLRKRRINNRRSRAIVRDHFLGRKDIVFDAVKYRSKVRAAASHAHLRLSGELGTFLFEGWQRKTFETPLFESFRCARHSASAIYELPFTIAEGLAGSLGVSRETFLKKIAPRMTANERLRMQETAKEVKKLKFDLDWERLPLTRLAIYLSSLSSDERRDQEPLLTMTMRAAAKRTVENTSLRLGRVAAVLDISYSSSGSSEKRRRPFALTLAAHFLLEAGSDEYQPFWTIDNTDRPAILKWPRGQTDLATPILSALKWKPELMLIMSDGYENDPPQGAVEILRLFRGRIDPAKQTSIIHVNPVFQPDDFTLRQLSPSVPTVGLRDAEDLATVLAFARFAEGTATLNELESLLFIRAQEYVKR